MNEKSPVLKGEIRERLGSRYAKRLREQGRLPVVVYGHGKETTCDLARVDLDEVTHAHVHVVLKGDAVGLKTAGTLLMHPTTELTVECKLKDLPSEIVVSVKDLEAGGIIHAGDITLPAGVKLLSDAENIVAQITHTAAEEESEVSSDAEPEVIKEKKDEDE